MEPEKLDALFRQKMENFQKTPSPDAWAKLQSRMEPKKEEKKPVMWLYYVAASVMLVLVSGVLWIANRSENNTGTQLATTKTEIQKPVNVKQPELNGTENVAQIAQNQKGKPAYTENGIVAADLANQPKNETRQLAAVTTKNQIRPKNKPGNEVLNKAIAPESTLANQTKKTEKPVIEKTPETMLANQSAKATAKPETGNVSRETLEILIIKNAPEAEALAVNETAEIPEEDQKQSKLQLAKNIGKQLLNLKRGEKIDRTELGLPENYTVAFETKILKQKINKTINL